MLSNDLALDLPVRSFRDQDFPGFRQALQSGGNIDAVADNGVLHPFLGAYIAGNDRADMNADPAELIFFQQMTTDRFFDEAKDLGYELDELQDEETYNHIFYTCLVKLRSATAKSVAGELGIEITDEWRRVHSHALTTVVSELGAASGQAEYHADRQERASRRHD